MSKKLLLVILPLVVLAFAGQNDLVSDPDAISIPADPNAPLIVEVPVDPETDQPPFGTVMAQWNLAMSGTYKGSGVTWRRDSGRFYLLDQGGKMWSLDPANPTGTMRDENWTFPNLGGSAADIPWGLAWDDDSGCFWMSNIIDGSISAGCFLLRMTPAGTWTGDSWHVGANGNGGALGCLWTAGMEKWIDRGFFCVAPVFSGSGSGNYVCKFDPYTKTNLGRVAQGDLVSERGCALVPYDSLYILTCGWNADNWRKRDSSGHLLQQVATANGPADWAMYVPENINPLDTVIVYCMCNNSTNTFQKISLGMTWGQLPSVNPWSVAPTAILAPAGAVDSGVVLTPRVVIRNKSEDPADSVHITIEIEDAMDAVIYSDETYVLNLAAGGYDTLAFTTWAPIGRDSLTVTAWTFWQGDSSPQDDTLSQRFMVRTKNVGITQILAPPSVADSGVVYFPRCRVYNYGTQSETFNLNFRIGAYDHDVLVNNLPPNFSRIVTATVSWTAMPGSWLHTLTAELAGDIHPEDNVMVDTIDVAGIVGHDVAAEEILAPLGFYDTLTAVVPMARVANYGGASETFWTWFTIWDTTADVQIYRQTIQVTLAGGANTTIAYPSAGPFTVLGPYVGQCSTYLAGDQVVFNDVIDQGFMVSSAQHDVSLSMILAPAGTIDSGAAITPTIVIHNGGLYTENFPAYFELPGGYLSVANIIDLIPGTADTIQFVPDWNANYRDSITARAWCLLTGDERPENDTLEQDFYVQVGDVGVVQVIYPVDTVPENTWMTPQAEVHNYGTRAETFDVEFRIGLFLTTMTVDSLAPGATVDLTFPDSLQASPGIWLDQVTTLLAGDINPDNNVALDTFWVPGVLTHDVGVVNIFQPVGSHETTDVITPTASVKNFGTVAETWTTTFTIYDDGGTPIYTQSQSVTLDTGIEDTLTFPALQITNGGDYTGRCSTYLAIDQNWVNNVIAEPFEITDPGLWPGGWHEVLQVPLQPSGKPVKRGGWLAINDDRTIYAGKGYKTGDFYKYDALLNEWTPLALIKLGREGKMPKKGTKGVCDGDNYVYMTKGNNTLGWWRYDIAQDSWYQLTDVPEGWTGKRVKGGTDLLYITKNDTGWVYMLKGYKTEFYKYNTVTGIWTSLPDAPTGIKYKWNKGSWIVAEPPGGPTPAWRLFAHKARYYNRATYEHEMWQYDLLADTWSSTQLHGMPLYGLHGGRIKKKKSKDGGSAAYYDAKLYALKGGNTQQFWRYNIAGDTWVEIDTVPTRGSTARKKRIKYGADIVHYGGGAFFALKGNKTVEMWRYVIPYTAYRPAGRSGVMAGPTSGIRKSSLTISPNPLTGDVAGVRYTLPNAGPATLTVYDVTGRARIRQHTHATRTGTLALDVRNLSAGIYLVRLDAGTNTVTTKLVIQH